MSKKEMNKLAEKGTEYVESIKVLERLKAKSFNNGLILGVTLSSVTYLYFKFVWAEKPKPEVEIKEN